MVRFSLRFYLLALGFPLVAPVALAAEGVDAAPASPPAEFVLRGGTLVDGSGAPAVKGDLAVRGDRIVAVGRFPVAPGVRVVDVSSLVVAPGFIDLHTHSDEEIRKPGSRLNLNYLTQGVTTVVTGNCGSGPIEVASYLAAIDAHGAGANVIHLVPHGNLRHAVLGLADRPPEPRELDRMKALLARGLKAGGWGMATGLIYVPGCSAGADELIALARVVADSGGLYASHIRNEEDGLLEAIDEAIAIGKSSGAPVHISHLKADGKANWGRAAAAIERIVAARNRGQVVTADQYPYVASCSKLAPMVIPPWALRGDAEEFARLAASSDRGGLLRAEIRRSLDRREGGAAIRIARYPAMPGRVGRDLAAIARDEGTTPLDVVLDIQRHGGAQAISFGMSEPDVRLIMRQDFVATASDGSSHVPGGGDRPHPRAYGTFPRKIRYALDEHELSLEQAIRSCTGLPAQILGLPDRGKLLPGAFADVVVFDPATFRDAATFEHPTRHAPGVRYLFLNGVAMIAEGKPTVRRTSRAKLPGRALRRQSDGPADVILNAGRIWTGDPALPWAESVASRGGVIVAVGGRRDLERYRGPRTTVVDRPTDLALPGLIDAHGHVEALGASLEQVDLRGVNSLDEVARRLKARIATASRDAWITGGRWDQSLWPGGSFPTASVLDAVAPDRPIWLKRVDGHAGWANSEALRRARIDETTAAPAGGQILHDSAGKPTGVLIDGAMKLVDRVVPSARPEDVKRHILAAQDAILAAGITGVHDAGLSQDVVSVYRELDRAGQLRLRIYGMASPPAGHEVEFASRPPPDGRPGARFELRAIKLFMDGALGSRGALLFQPYHDDAANTGLMLIDPKTLQATVTAAVHHGWQVATHAIGDRGNALVIDAYAAARMAEPQVRDARLRIEHAQVLRREDVARMAALGIIASMQPSHASSDMRWADARLGPERVRGAYAWRWFLDAGVPLAFGSDFPVEVVNPSWGLYAAVTRQDDHGNPPGGWHPDQVLTLDEALRGFTSGAARAAFAEHRLGMLRPGFRIDLTVVDRDLFKVSPKELLGARVTLTIIEGQVVYRRNSP